MCLLALVMVNALAVVAQSPKKAMEDHKVVPDVLTKAPEKLIEVYINNIIISYLCITKHI